MINNTASLMDEDEQSEIKESPRFGLDEFLSTDTWDTPLFANKAPH